MSNPPITMPRRLVDPEAAAGLVVTPPGVPAAQQPAPAPKQEAPAEAPAQAAPPAETASARPSAGGAKATKRAEPARPIFSGRRRAKAGPKHPFVLRVPEELWEKADSMAAEQNISTHEFILQALDAYVKKGR